LRKKNISKAREKRVILTWKDQPATLEIGRFARKKKKKQPPYEKKGMLNKRQNLRPLIGKKRAGGKV